MNQMAPLPHEGDSEKIKLLMQDLMKFQLDIEAALSYDGDRHTFVDVCRMVINGHMHLYTVEDTFAIMEPVQYNNGLSYNCFLAGGSMSNVLLMEKALEQICRTIGATRVTLSGRKGWIRALKHLGWREAHVTLVKEFDQ